MKILEVLTKLIVGAVGIVAVLWIAVEYLIIPAILVVIGLICGFGWEYYMISLAVYVVLVLLFHLIGHFMDKAIDKTVGPVVEEKLEKLFDRFIKNEKKENE